MIYMLYPTLLLRLIIFLNWSIQLDFWQPVATLLSSLIARMWVWLKTLWRFWLKDLSIDEMVGAWCFGYCQAHRGLPVGFLLLRYSDLWGKDQELIQSSTSPDPGYHMGKWQKHNRTSQTRAKRSALSQHVTTRQQWTHAKAWQTQDINNTNDPQKNYPLGTVSKNILLEGLDLFHGANLILSSDVDQDT